MATKQARKPRRRAVQVSLVIITYQKLAYLRATLDSLVALRFPRDRFEVIVVDDGSPDETFAFLQQYHPAYDFRFITKANGGIASARNAGIAEARGELLVMLDNDCIPAPDAVTHLWQAYQEAPDSMHIAQIDHVDVAHVPGVMAEIERGDFSLFERYPELVPHDKNDSLEPILRVIKANLARLTVGWFGAQGPSVSMSASAFRAIGGYDDRIRHYGMEDFDIAFRFVSAGGELRYVPGAWIHHLDHSRDAHKTFTEMTNSAKYFYEKHGSRPEAALFMKFLCGGLSLRAFNNAVAAAHGRPAAIDRELDLTFSPYRMVQHRDRQAQQPAARVEAETANGRTVRSRFLASQIEHALAAAPVMDLEPMDVTASNVLIVAPHMDDEVIGCGGLIQRYAEHGAKVTVAFLTTGSGILEGRDTADHSSAIAARIEESRRAANLLGIHEAVYFHLPERHLAEAAPSCEQLRTFLLNHAFDAIFVTGPDEFHPDHRAACAWVRDSIARLPSPPAVYFFEVWGNCQPDHVLELKPAEWSAKLRALAAYETQLEQVDYTEIMSITASHRGAALGRASARAEAFRMEAPCPV